MKRLALLCALALSACTQLPTEAAPHAPLDARADGGVMMGGGLHTPPTCRNDTGEAVPCP